MPYRKARPDRTRFPRLDRALVQDLGGVEKRPAACLLASWLAGGAALTEKQVSTPKGVVVVAPGQTWGSLMSAQEDVLALVGERFSYGTFRSAVQTLRSAGIIVNRHDPLPATRGKYGSVFTLSEPLIATPSDPVSVSATFIHRFYGDPADFRYASTVQGVLDTGRARRRIADADRFIANIGAHGLDAPAFVNVGRWRKGEALDPTAPVFVPWFTIDIDRNYLKEAWDDTNEIVERMADEGFDLDRTFISFSGRRGFHIQIGADQLDCPIFRDADAAKIASDELTARLCYGIKIDPSVNSPNQLLRVAGSKHDKSGLYKVTWTMRDFQATDFEWAMTQARDPQPTPMLDPRQVQQVESSIHDFFDAVSADTESRYLALRDRTGSGGGPGETMKSLLPGIAEGETWHPNHEGRNKAAFILACWLVEARPTGDQDIDAAFNAGGTERALDVWNRRNTPPLPDREIDACHYSASRRITGQRPARRR